MPKPEPWLRGPLPGISPLVANLFYSFAQVREELAGALDGLSSDQIWRRPFGLAPLGFHVRHLGGAAERLGIYLQSGQLTPEQLQELQAESVPGASGAELLTQLDRRLREVEKVVAAIPPETLEQRRAVGRAGLPSTAIGLIVHIAEHSQRHLGQAITMAKLVRSCP